MFIYRPRDRSTYPTEAADRAPAYLATWLARFPDSEPKDRDFEDWAESAALIHHVDQGGHDVIVLPDHERSVWISGVTGHSGTTHPNGPKAVMLGSWTRQDAITPLDVPYSLAGGSVEAVDQVENYPASATFQAYAGRAFYVASGNVSGEGGIDAALCALKAAGHDRAFVKTRHKGYASIVDLPEPNNGSIFYGIDDEDLMWLPVQLEDRPAAFYVQQVFEPTYEYRFFVIDNKVVTGAGCVESFTPLNNEALFDPKMEAKRNRSGVTSEPAVLQGHLDLARRYAASYAAENRAGAAYTLDVCIDRISGEHKVIEMNPGLHAGLYATDAQAYIEALAKICD